MYRRAWAGVAAVTLFVSGLATLRVLGPTLSLLVLGSVAGLGAVYGLALCPVLPRVRRSPVLTGSVVGAGVTVTSIGIAQAPGASGLGAVLVLLAASPPVASRIMAAVAGGPAPDQPPIPDTGTRSGFEVFLRVLDRDELQAAWDETGVALRQAPNAEAASQLVAVRQLYLDEIERRDPEAFTLWQ
jgi:hypothetical protein